MRYLLALACFATLAVRLPAQDSHKRVADALLEIHENGRAIYNGVDADYVGAYRMYQGGLMFARRMLTDRPDLQKVITDGLAAADRLSTADRKAYRLHEVIEAVRIELGRKAGKATERTTIPPREVGPTGKPAGKPAPAVTEVRGGVVGRVMWQGQPLGGVDVTFVTLGRQPPQVFETATSGMGVYEITTLPAGKYVILITRGPNASAKKLPERYATTTTSPLRFDVKGGGEKLDFVLQ